MDQRLVFGLVPAEATSGIDALANQLVRWIGDRAGVYLVRRQVATYKLLATQLVEGQIHVAWLPPVVFAGIDGRAGIAPIASCERASRGEYLAVLVARAGSHVRTIEDLAGAKVAWIDPLSASGYVVPRLELARQGIDPRRLFSRETFYGSHEAAIRAVTSGEVDVAATYARFDDQGRISSGPWTHTGAQVQVVTTFGGVPADLIAAREDVSPAVRSALVEALVASTTDPVAAPLVARVFGVDHFARPLVRYASLRRDIETAVESGMIDAAVAFISTLPPPPQE